MENVDTQVIGMEEVRSQLPAIVRNARATALAIKDPQSYEAAGRFLVQIKGFRKRIEELFGPVVRKAYDAWKSAQTLRKQMDDPLDQAESEIKSVMADYHRDEERRRKEEEARIQAEMKKRDEESRLEQAVQMEKAGNGHEAEMLLNQPMVVPPVVLPMTKADGVGMRETWSAEVTDKMGLIRAVAEGKVDPALLEPNMTALNQMARALKSALNIPGVKAVARTTVSARAA